MKHLHEEALLIGSMCLRKPRRRTLAARERDTSPPVNQHRNNYCIVKRKFTDGFPVQMCAIRCCKEAKRLLLVWISEK